MFRLKRAYEPRSPDDGQRVLVERLWPRGLTKAKAAIDLWQKDVAPSPELRKWFAHDPAKWPAFQRRYRAELKSHPDAIAQLRQAARRGPVTLIYAARDETHNAAVALRDYLSPRRLRPKSRPQSKDARRGSGGLNGRRD